MKRVSMKNNKGMTLVEVLVAIMVLTVVSLTLLRAFVSSTQYNMKAKEKQRQVNLAQSIMESLKAYSLEDICRQFEGKDPFRIYLGAQGAHANANGSNLDADGKFVRNDGGPTPANADKYSFTIDDVIYDGGIYDITIDLERDTKVDLIEEAEIPQYNKFNDAFYNMDTPGVVYELIYSDVVDFLHDRGMKASVGTLTNDQKNCVKVVSHSITVSTSDSGGVQVVNVTETYDYELVNLMYEDEDDHSHTLNANRYALDDYVITKKIYDNTVTSAASAKLNNIYINYYPIYEASSDSVIIAGCGASGKVYLLRQTVPGLSSTQLNTAESSYRPSVTATGAEIYTNAYANLASDDGNRIAGCPTAPAYVHEQMYEKKWKALEFNVTIKITNQKNGQEFELIGSIYD